MDNVSDAARLRASVDRPAEFAAVYERHLGAVATYLTRRVGGEPAEDLSAEVFVRAFRARARFRADHETALPWLLGIANNLIADHRRVERRRLAALQRLTGAPANATTLATAAGGGTSGLPPQLVRQLRRLSTADRDTLLLVVWGELSYEEAATALDVPVGTVRSRINRARRQLATGLSMTSHEAGGSLTAATGGELNA
jgi:DNA-directed RNA polymerase specialized sigma24 family protein